MQLNLIYDPSTNAAPAGFKVAMAAAAQYLDGLITNPITVNISVGFGEDGGAPLSGDESTGGPSSGIDLGYAELLQDLAANVSSAQDGEAVARLPASDPSNGAQFFVAPAEEKAWGLLPADGTEIDGTVGFSSTYRDYNYDPTNRAQPGLEDFVGVAEHELTHALARIVDVGFTTAMDLFRFSAPGVRELVSGQPAYFSIDNGTTDLGNYDTTSDPSDWNTATGPDFFDAFSSTGVVNPVTPNDITEMNVLGFAVDTPPSTVTAYTVSDEASLNGALAAVRFSAADLTYTITVAAGLPGGTLNLDTALFAVLVPTGATLFITGNGETIDGGGAQAGLTVASGSVAITDLTVAHTLRRGGDGADGAGGGGGGAGEGGGLLVQSGAVVTLNNVAFSGDAAAGGTGGNAQNNFDGGNGGALNGGTIGNGASLASTAGGPGGDGQGGGGGGNFYLSTTSGPGGQGGFGGGGGGGGYYQAGAYGLGGGGGFGGGAGGAAQGAYGGGGGGGGGMAAGADVFVAAGGVLTAQAGVLAAGTVTGGTGGAGGTPQAGPDYAGQAGGTGEALGSGIFLQGAQQIELGPEPGTTLTVGGAIADQTGSGGTGANAGSGSIVLAGGGTVRLAAAGSYTGGTFLEAGDTLDLAATGAAGGNAVVFLGAGVLRIEAGVTVTNVLSAFGPGDVVDFLGVTNGAQPAPVSLEAGNRLAVGTAGVQLDPGLTYVPDQFHASVDAGDRGTTVSYVACFRTGTRIDSLAGPIPVETLRIGDRVMTARGAPRRVAWLGHRRIDCRRQQRPADVWPIRVAARAFGAGRPRRDLWLSPDHAVFVDGMLIPVRYLVNGATIAQLAADTVVYWHVELDRHDLLLAEGLPCESYLDTGNRGAFEATPFAAAAQAAEPLPVLLLALDAALAQCSVAVVADGRVLAERRAPGGRGHGAVLPPLAQQVLRDAAFPPTALDGVAVTIGPGSFTGLRAAIALSQGIALAAGCPVIGVTVAEALAAALPPLPGWRIWVAIDSRRGRVFLDRAGTLDTVTLDRLPPAGGRVAVAGDAAVEVAARLLARGDAAMLTDARLPLARHVAAVGARRLRGELPALPAQPLYVDPPEARLPKAGARPPPAA